MCVFKEKGFGSTLKSNLVKDFQKHLICNRQVISFSLIDMTNFPDFLEKTSSVYIKMQR